MNLIRINEELIINLDAVGEITLGKTATSHAPVVMLCGPCGPYWIHGDEAERLWDRLQYLSTPLPAAVATPDLAEIDETA